MIEREFDVSWNKVTCCCVFGRSCGVLSERSGGQPFDVTR